MKNRLQPWMIKSAMAFAWFAGIVSNTPFMLETTGVVNGVCYTWILYKCHAAKIGSLVFYILAFYVIILVIFIFCYGRILIVIRRQARVMSSHGAAGSSTSHTQSHHIQTNVIKTMIIVSAFYAIAWLPTNAYYAFIMIEPNRTYASIFWYASIFAAFLYSAANPFIYATKFDPVRRVLKGMIPFKNTSSIHASDVS